MILDGYWKKELKQIKRSLLFWSNAGKRVLSDYSEHKINRAYLYSAAIIRKISEDEKEAEVELSKTSLPLPALEILKIKVKVFRYKHVDQDKFFVNSRVILSDYDTKNAIEGEISLFEVCNQVIHSYVWGVVYSGKPIYGVLLASDWKKEKEVLLLPVNEWIKVIDEVVKKATIDLKKGAD